MGLPPGNQPSLHLTQRLRSLFDMGIHMIGSTPKFGRHAVSDMDLRRERYTESLCARNWRMVCLSCFLSVFAAGFGNRSFPYGVGAKKTTP